MYRIAPTAKHTPFKKIDRGLIRAQFGDGKRSDGVWWCVLWIAGSEKELVCPVFGVFCSCGQTGSVALEAVPYARRQRTNRLCAGAENIGWCGLAGPQNVRTAVLLLIVCGVSIR